MELESRTEERAAREASLRRAVREGDVAGAAALIAEDAALAATSSERGGSLVLEAVERGHSALAELLLLARDGGSMVGMSVHEAAALGRPAALKHALTEDMTAAGDVGPSGFLPLHRAAHRGHLEATTVLLEMGADPGAHADNQARTVPLESVVAGASQGGDASAFAAVARLLVAAGADPDAASAAGLTPREDAERRGVADLFPADGADAPPQDAEAPPAEASGPDTGPSS